MKFYKNCKMPIINLRKKSKKSLNARGFGNVWTLELLGSPEESKKDFKRLDS